MSYSIHLFYGLIMAYFGLISPGMLNMTALKIRIEVGKGESVKFSLGASTIVLVQAAIALFFADFFIKNPNVIEVLKIAGVFVFFLLSFFFFKLSQKKIKTKTTNKKGNYYGRGLVLSMVNMLAIPFYLGISIFLAAENKIMLKQPYILFFIFGAALGSFLLFYTYIIFAKIISKKVSFIAKNINIILSLLFAFLGILTLIKVLP